MSEQKPPFQVNETPLLEELDRYRFIAKLDDAIRYLTDPEEITCSAAGLLGRYLGASRCAYAYVSDDSSNFTLAGNYTDGVPGMAGHYAMAAFGSEYVRLNTGGLPYIVDDVDADERVVDALQAYRDVHIRAVVSVPIMKGGRMVAGMALHQATPRPWRDHEVKLLGAVATRCWESIERSRIASELRKAEERVQASHDYLRLLLDCTEEGFYSVDRDGVTIMCNAAFLKMLGFEREEQVIGRRLHDLIHHSHPDGSHYHVCDCPIYKAGHSGTPAYVPDELFFRLDGSAFPVEYRAQPVWQNGELQGAVCTFVDLSNQKRTEQALQQSLAHSEALFAQTAAGMCETDVAGKICRVNDRFCQLVGRSREELLSLRMQDITYPDDLVRNFPLLEKSVAAGEHFEIEQRYVRPDGSVVWINNTVGPVRSVKHGPVSILSVSVDISERKRAEEALLEADRRKDEFLAMLAHELRNPMAPIRAAADLMRVAHLDTGRLMQTSGIISRQVQHMTGLVDDLLDVSRVTRGLIKLEKASLDVKQIITDALEQVRPLLEAKKHHLTVDLDPEPAHVLGDQKRLIQILANLLNNAAKYTPPNGSIHLSMQVPEHCVLLRVADNGVGIPAEMRSSIFELFAQVERSPDRSQGGLGIGLALARSLVELHGGTIRCESGGIGQGSEFIVSMPRIAKVGDKMQDREDLVRAPVKRKRILIVDDNADAAQMLAMYLEIAGHAVLVEHDSERALDRARIELPDVCILDIGLPGMDGNELARRLRSQRETAETVLIAATGYGQEQDRQRSLASGFDHHLVKPVDADRLLSLISASAA
jgi:PAS domain S-box-containing protein